MTQNGFFYFYLKQKIHSSAVCQRVARASSWRTGTGAASQARDSTSVRSEASAVGLYPHFPFGKIEVWRQTVTAKPLDQRVTAFRTVKGLSIMGLESRRKFTVRVPFSFNPLSPKLPVRSEQNIPEPRAQSPCSACSAAHLPSVSYRMSVQR